MADRRLRVVGAVFDERASAASAADALHAAGMASADLAAAVAGDRTHVVETRAGRRLEAGAVAGALIGLVAGAAVAFGLAWVVWPDAGVGRSLALATAGGFVAAVVGAYLGMGGRREFVRAQRAWESVELTDGEVALAIAAPEPEAASILERHGGRRVGTTPAPPDR